VNCSKAKEKLLRLPEHLHETHVGQEEAVTRLPTQWYGPVRA
jgi:hypothetical protein